MFSVSNDGMKVVNPMETIPEGKAVDIQVSQHPSITNVQNSVNVCSSPSSPTKTRRFQNTILSGIRSPFNNSKISLDGLKVGSLEKNLKLGQPLNGVGLCSRQSYLEDWLSEHESVIGSSKSPSQKTDSAPQTPSEAPSDTLFKMDVDDSNNPQQKTANLDLKVHLLGLGFLNRDVGRVSQEPSGADHVVNMAEPASPPCVPASDTADCTDKTEVILVNII